MIIAISSIAVYSIILLMFKNKPIVQQLLLYIVYIVSATYFQGLDIALPIYFVVSFIPFIRGGSKVERLTFIAACILGIYLIMGVFFQNASRAITMFISRCWQFLFFFIVLNNRKKIDKTELNYNAILYLSFVLESILAMYLFLTKRNIYSVVRLTAGAQPITGNTAVAVIPIMIFGLFVSRTTKEQNKTIFAAFLLAIWVALSGTRGYELVYALVLVWLIWIYIFRLSKFDQFRNRLFMFLGLSIIAIGILIIVPQYMDKVVTLLRLNKKSIGIRTYENAAAEEFFLNASILTKLFGVGIGGQLGHYSEFRDALSKQFALGMWNKAHYLYDSGSLFHNLYMNILCNMGIVGIITIVALVVGSWKKINTLVSNKYLNLSFKVFLIGILVMNYFRWSTDCGIAIMAILALIIKKINFYESLNES